MTQQFIMLIVGCIMMFIGGLVSGIVFSARRNERFRRERDEAVAEYEAAGSECAALRKKHGALIEEYRNVYDSYNVMRQKASRMEAELQSMSDERAAQRAAVGRYEKAAFDYNTRLEQLSMVLKENQVLSMQVAVQRKRISELEALREVGDRYREAIAFIKTCQIKIKQLQDELMQVKSEALQPRPTGKTVSFRAITRNGTLANICNRILEASATNHCIKGGVIADDMGFPIVSTSEFTDELAGISVLHQYCSRILEKNIGFGNVARMTFRNTANQLCTIMPFVVNGQMVYYAGISQADQPVKKAAAGVTDAVIFR